MSENLDTLVKKLIDEELDKRTLKKRYNKTSTIRASGKLLEALDSLKEFEKESNENIIWRLIKIVKDQEKELNELKKRV